MQTHIDLFFANGEYRFALGLAQINEIQNACGDGIGAIYARVLQGRIAADIGVSHPGYAAFKQADLLETVRHGLIGGGQGMVDGQEVKVEGMRANQLVTNYFLELPLSKQWDLAAAILHAKFEGFVPEEGDEDDTPDAPGSDSDKKKAGGLTTPEPLPTA